MGCDTASSLLDMWNTFFGLHFVFSTKKWEKCIYPLATYNVSHNPSNRSFSDFAKAYLRDEVTATEK